MTHNEVVKAFTVAMERMRITYIKHKSKSSNSMYFRLKYKSQINRVYVRISTHELQYNSAISATPWEGAIKIEIGKKPWADYDYDNWYLCLDKIASLFPCQETKIISRKIIAEEQIKRKPLPESVQRTIAARKAKEIETQRKYEEKMKAIREARKKKRS